MTKVKMPYKSVVGGSATSIKMEANSATPSLASKAKIQKNRTNTKGEIINPTQSNYINKYLKIQSQIRLCFVNVKRHPSLHCSSNSVVSVDNGPTNNQVTTTLHDHSKVGKSLVAKNSSMSAEAIASVSSSQDKALNGHNGPKSDGNNNTFSYKTNNISQRPYAVEHQRTTALKDTNGNKKDDVLKIQDKPGTANVTRKCVVKLQKLPKSSQTKEFYARNAAKDALLASQIISPTLDHEKRIAFRKLSLSMHSNPTDNDGKQTLVESNMSGIEMLTSNSKTLHNTTLQKQKPAISPSNNDTLAQRNLRTSVQPATYTKMKLQKECHNANRNRNQFPSTCKENSIDGISDRNIKKDSSKENLIGNQCINTSFTNAKEIQTRSSKRCATPKYGELLNALTPYNNILASKAQNLSISKSFESHRNTTVSKANELQSTKKSKLCSEILSNSKLLVTKLNKNYSDKKAQKESHNENRIKNTAKGVPPSRCRQNQTDKVLDNCIAKQFPENLVQKESINLNGDNANSMKRAIENDTDKETQTESLNENRIEKKAKGVFSSRCRQNQTDKVLDNCIAKQFPENRAQKESINKCLNGDNADSIKRAIENDTDKETQTESHNENRIEKKAKGVFSSRCRQNQTDKVLDNCIAKQFPENLAQKESINKCLNGDNADSIKRAIENDTDKETQTESHNENRIEKKAKGVPSSRCRENQFDKVLDNCIANEFSEKLVQKQTISKCLNRDNTNTITGAMCKDGRKKLEPEKSILNSHNVQVVATAMSPSKVFHPQRNSTLFSEDRECSPKLTSIGDSAQSNSLEKDAPKKESIKLIGNPFNYKKEKIASKQRPHTATEANTKLPTLRTSNKTMNTTEILDFQPQRNSTMRFEHPQHLSEITSDVEDIGKEGAAQDKLVTGVSDNTSHNHSTIENHTKSTNKTNKFFHRHETEYSKRIEIASTKNMVSTNTKNCRFMPKRTSQLRREHVYDFLSQSQTSDSDGMGGGTKKHKRIDPAADIIQKLIAEGKVVVATCKKGKGKPVFKRNYKKRLNKGMQNNKVAMKNNLKAIDNKIPSKHLTEQLKSTQLVVDDHFMDNDNDDDDVAPAILGEDYTIRKPSTVESAKNVYRTLHADQEGTFSNLAISVLINQAGRNDPQKLKAQRLLSIAKKLISTPKNKNIPSIRTTINANFSPILPLMQPRPATKPSPWRIDEDAHLPRVFNFTRSSGNLPSFSSDFIPPTPRKEKPSTRNKSKGTEIEEQQAKFKISPLPIIEGISAIPSHFSTPLVTYSVNSSIPSFSSNDSNAENKTPPGKHNQSNDENSNIFNLKQLPNPRRTLNYRSPLQAINIIEVVQLPSLEMSKITNYKEMYQPQVAAICNSKELSKNGRLKSVSISNEDLYGFEDLLSQTENSGQEDAPQVPNDVHTTRGPPNTINEKLHELRKFKPVITELQISLQQAALPATGTLPGKNKDLFVDNQSVPKPQHTVKELLCSTMLHEKPTTSRNALKNRRDDAHYTIGEESNKSGMLFRDLEPETTFNEEDPHRTYMRPHKRKRRIKDDGLIYAFESEESDIEENDLAEKKKAFHNQSRETDTSSEKQPPNKKKKRQRKENPELTLFVKEFNEMCKEVENYNLIVEKSIEVV